MRNPDAQQIALECLRLANGINTEPAEQIVERAERYFAFVTGEPTSCNGTSALHITPEAENK